MGMNPRIKAQWVRAMQNGTYEQGHNQLCNVDPDIHGADGKRALARKLARKLGPRRMREKGIRRCCLAVLCDMAARSGEITDLKVTVTTGEFWRGDAVCYDGQAMLLPRSVMEWAGLQEYADHDGTGGYDVRFNRARPADDFPDYETLSNMNDSLSVPFTQTPDENGDYEGIAETIARCL